MIFAFRISLFAQETDLEFSLDVASSTVPLPKIFKPNIDLSGRGLHRNTSWPQSLTAPEVLELWQKDIGFSGIYRLQYNLWEIGQFTPLESPVPVEKSFLTGFIKDKELQDNLLNNYEKIIKNISDAGGIVLLDIFGTPQGFGKVLDKKSAPFDLKAFKKLIKSHIKTLSCDKRYNIWYEVWSAPDLDDFFLGRKQEYLNLYRQVAESIKELRSEYKIHIPLGGPSASWWFQNLDGNTIITPEKSLIYELIKFCYRNKLPLDFISWHSYSTDPKVDKELTAYKKSGISLIRDWLTYFHFDKNIPLLVDEWNYDLPANILRERKEDAHICASYIASRIKNMYEAGLDYQLYFSLEDFSNLKEGVVRNTGIFWFNPEFSEYKGGPKSTYNLFRMLSHLGSEVFLPSPKFEDEFVGIIATKGNDYISILIYNYIDPEIAINFLSRNISSLGAGERKFLLNLVKSEKIKKVWQGQLDIASLRTSKRLKTLLKKAKELNDKAVAFKSGARNLRISIKNLHPVRSKAPEATAPPLAGTSNGVNNKYIYQRWTIDSSCGLDCQFAPLEEKEINTSSSMYQEVLSMNPYSVNLIVLRQKPREEPIPRDQGQDKE